MQPKVLWSWLTYCAPLQPPRMLLEEGWTRFASFQLWKPSNFEHDILTTSWSERSMVYRWMGLICQIPHPPFRISISIPSDWFRGPLQTQGVVLAIAAERLLAASLCVASATCEYIKSLNPPSVTFVETGARGGGSGDEDIACADYMAGLLDGTPPELDQIERRVRNSRAAQKFVGDNRSVFPRADLEEALKVDCFDFAMEAHRRNGQLVLKAVRHGAASEQPK